MAGPGGGPPRRSHTKSRKGCETCKRRHIRCDENFPQCRNCTKHNVRCPYMDMPPQDDRASTPEKADLMWTPEIVAEIELWQQTGISPFPELNVNPAPNPQFYSIEDLRLMHHVAMISREMAVQDAGTFTIWTTQIPLFLRIGATCGYVMHALLAFSATSIAWFTDDPLVNQMAFEHQGLALKGLHEAIGSFSRETSDAILAASLLLSWQANEWRGWTQLMHGTSSVIDAMQPWKNESLFGDFIAEKSTFPTAPPSPTPNEQLSQPRKQDIAALQLAYSKIQEVESALESLGEGTKSIVQLLNFVRSIRKVNPSHSAAERFEMLNPLRKWLFWLPVSYLQQSHDSAYALVILAYHYTVALVVEPIFPEIGAAYFGSLSLGPIEEIARRLFSINISQAADGGLRTPLALMEYPIDMVSTFRARMGWQQPERTASFPTFENSGFQQPGMYDMSSSFGSSIYGTNPAFTYSQEHLTHYTSSEPASAITPLTLDPFIGASGNYLGIPSPSGFGGYHSPSGSSTFGDIAYSDHGGDDFLFEPHHSTMAAYGGTPPFPAQGSTPGRPSTSGTRSALAITPIVPSSPREFGRFRPFSPHASPRAPYSQTYVSHTPPSNPAAEAPSPKGKGPASGHS